MMKNLISRRGLMGHALAGTLLLAGCQRKKPMRERNSGLIKSFGLEPDRYGFRHIYAAGSPAEILLFALAPNWLLGWSSKKSEQALTFLPESARSLPVLGSINGRGSSVSFETLLEKRVDLIVDVGNRTETYVSTASRTAEQLHVPYLLIDGRLALAPEQIKQLGLIINSPDTQRLTALAQQAVAFAATVAADLRHGIHVYYARGADGLETGLKDSIHTELIDMLGAINSADELGSGSSVRVSLEQILRWRPDMIVTQNEQLMHSIYRQPVWHNVKAVANRAVYLLPNLPVGWIDGPPGINRLLGIYALAPILQGLPRNTYSAQIQELYQAIYHTELTPSQLKFLGLYK